MTDRARLPPIKYAELAEALLARGEQLVSAWLPGGRKHGHEYICGSLDGGQGSSCSVNLVTGAWADFSTEARGKDLLSLYAAIHDLTMAKAAVQVARDEGLEDVAGVQRSATHERIERPPAPPPPPKPKEDEGWKTVRPVPPGSPEANFRHQYRQPQDLEHVSAYRVGEELHGYVVRFRTSDGGKDTLPRTWCVSARDGAFKWHWKQFDEPRPLFLPGGAMPEGRTVVLVEGEIKGEVLQQLLDETSPGVYCVASWPGGSKAWKKADWSWLAGCSVLLWPDCDAKREAVPKATQASVLAQAMEQLEQIGGDITEEDRKRVGAAALALVAGQMPILPEGKQPGMGAMRGIGALLRDEHGCRVDLLPIPQPGAVVDGWDCKDAIKTDGWDHARVLAFFAQAQPLPDADADADAPVPKSGGGGGKNRDPLGEPPPSGSGGDAFDEHLDWMVDELGLKGRWEIGVNRSLVIQALRKSPHLKDCLGYDVLRDGPCTREPWPWRDDAGPIDDDDDLQLGDWLVRNYKIKSAARAALDEAIKTVSGQHRFHPFREWMDGLKWDGRKRRDKWLLHVLGHEVDKLDPKLRRYLEMVSEFVLLGHVYRVMEPGCKFDYSVVLEGITGMSKSTLIEELVGTRYFSDTHFDIGAGKDGMEQLGGILAYELSEMTAFRRADSEAVKQFFSTKKDRYRGAYGKYVKDHPRQCVIWCTTNKRQYLYDLTGNRRFWPVWVGALLNVAWIRKWRDQLFAEALAAYREGARYWPTPEEERKFFKPEQEKRLVQTSVQARLYDLMTREGVQGGELKSVADINRYSTFVTIDKLVQALGVDPGKSSTLLEGQIRDWLLENGWSVAREGGGARRRGFKQPMVWPPIIDEDEEDGETAVREQTGSSAGDSSLPPIGWDDDEPF